MALDPQELRIDGIYQQRQPGFFMLRVKIPGGVLSSEQALKLCEIAERFTRGSLHLTSRASIEFHWLGADDLAPVLRMLAEVGLTSRGACGGAVRGVVCSTPFLPAALAMQLFAQRLHHHFTGHPAFEALPKKFKIGVDAGYDGARHLIQDVGLVFRGETDGMPRYDVWTAGGLGREPLPAFLLEEKLPEGQIIPLIEATIQVYRDASPPGKRLKHLVTAIGREELRHRIGARIDPKGPTLLPSPLDRHLTAPLSSGLQPLQAGVFAGELGAAAFRCLAECANSRADGFLVITCDQNVAIFPTDEASHRQASEAIAAAGFRGESRAERVVFRVCPGTHQCRLGLAATRDVAHAVLESMGPGGERLDWAISGCANSCSQPQLAQRGIVATRLITAADGEKRPLFDLYRRQGNDVFGTAELQGVELDELLRIVAAEG